MGGKRKPNKLQGRALACTLLWASCALGQTKTTIRHHSIAEQVNAVSPSVTEAEGSIEKQDYANAEKLLLPVVAANPKDDRAWYDLAYVYRATKRRDPAEDAYKKSLAAKPDFFESNLNLGLMLAQDGKNDSAAKYLQTAVKLLPANAAKQQKFDMWMALGQARERMDPDEAVAAYRKAAELSPADATPHLRAAHLLEASRDVRGAESEYMAAIAADPKSQDALAGLAELYRDNSRPENAAAALRAYAAQFPNDARVHVMLGQQLLKSGDNAGALQEFDAGLKQSPSDMDLLHEVASLCAAQRKFDTAAPHYADLVQAAPNNASYRYEYGVVLMQLHKFPQAQEQLITALKIDGTLVDAYGELAVAASENKQYPLAINVLDARAKLAPETPATYFLRATAYDNLKALPQAAENYHKFLDAANGKFPDNEWKARHRLIAIEPENKKNKKKK